MICSLTEALRLSTDLSQIMHMADELSTLAQDLSVLLPAGIQKEWQLAPVRDKTLVLLVSNNGIATRLKHLVPSLLLGLQTKGWGINALRIRVTSFHTDGYDNKPPEKQAVLNQCGMDSLVNLRNSLAESPLRAALERMIQRHLQDKR